MEGYQQTLNVIIVIALTIISTSFGISDNEDLHVCEEFKRNDEIQRIIATSRDKVPACACVEQQIALDYTFKKDGRCYSQWFSEEGVKQMCCYSEEGILLTGSPNGGYLLTDDLDMILVKEGCCKTPDICKQFYTLNPSNDCSSYRPPQTVTSWGDPVIQTIDGAKYDFNGHGEYVFLKTSNFEIQARTDYATPGNFDSTLFSAFAFYDNSSSEQIEFHHNRTTDDIIIYRKGESYCNAKRTDNITRPHPCLDPPKYRCYVLAGGGSVIIQGCGIGNFSKQIEIGIAGGLSLKVDKNSKSESMNFTGLAGNLKNGTLVGRSGAQISFNASDYERFNISETWALQSEEESRFYYNITGGGFEKYKKNHTVPVFMEALLGNLTELFSTFTTENITLFNETCRDYWNNEPNKECLLDIAKNKNITFGIAVMREANRTRKIWEINHNQPPVFLDGMPTNITVVYKKDTNWILNLTEYVDDENKDQLRFQVPEGFPTNEYTLESGVFNWTIGNELRNRTSSLTFIAFDILNASKTHAISIQYCGCERPSECNFELSTFTDIYFRRARCDCLQYYDGDYCEDFIDPCTENGSISCYNGCNFTLPKPSPGEPSSWPCLPCPEGRQDKLTNNKQLCNDIDECLNEEICEYGRCNNVNESYYCTCNDGFEDDNYRKGCKDINECDNLDVCAGPDQVCDNTLGNYTCSCKSGYQWSKDGGECVKIPGKVYVSTVSFNIAIRGSQIRETIDSPENRMEVQTKLSQRYEHVTGFISIEVIKLTIIIDSGGSRKKRADGNQHLNVKFILMLNQTFNTTSIEKTLNNANQNSVKPHIDGLEVFAIEPVKVSKDICSVPAKIDCDILSTYCNNLEDGYECICKQGFKPFKTIKTECKDIDECELFRRNGTTDYRCVYGACINTIGSWNCTCPNDRQLQSVGNDSTTIYRCEGNYTYIGEIMVTFDSALDNGQHVEELVLNKIRSVFADKTLKDNGYDGVHISSLFVSVSVLTREETSTTGKLPERSYNIIFKMRIGEEVETKRLQPIIDSICNKSSPPLNSSSVVSFKKCHMFNDSENVLCDRTSQGGCDEQTAACGQHKGKTYCKCKPGYEKHSEEDKFCKDQNECTDDASKCSGHGNCTNTIGGYTCECTAGYVLNDTDPHNITCIDIDECSSEDYKCLDGVCENLDGNWTCSCNETFKKNEISAKVVTCSDIDECSNKGYHCGGICSNTKGSWSCECPDGFVKHTDQNNITCEDFDECSNDTELVRCVHGTCVNTPGSWHCICTADRPLKEVDNETVRMYRCQGNFNYIGNITALVISEQINGSDVEKILLQKVASAFSNKTFKENGSFGNHISNLYVNVSVLAREEFSSTEIPSGKRNEVMLKWRIGEGVDGKRLQNVMDTLCEYGKARYIEGPTVILLQKCHIFTDSEHALCKYTSQGGCDEQTAACDQHKGKTYCKCKTGYENHSEGDKYCKDINECGNKTYKCHGGNCINQIGNWSCRCENNTFAPVRNDTYNIECTEQHVNACTVYPTFECLGGSKSCDGNKWNCKCKKGEMEMPVSNILTICQDENECTSNDTCSGHGTCENHADGYTCNCNGGYVINDTDKYNVSCIDIDECNSTDYKCTGGVCENFDGGWSCSCNETGFRRVEETSKVIACEDIDECKDHSKYFCGGVCTNSIGNWSCNCSSGFKKIPTENNMKILCEDINECDRSDACINGICENKNGTWDCFCHKGKKLKSINDTSKICYEEFHYVMSIQIASTSSVQGSKDDLMLYLEFQIKAAYEAAFRGHNVRIEIISITTQNEKRKRRDAAKNLKVKYIVHTDEETPSKNLTNAWHNYIANCGKICIKKNGISSKLPFDIILSDDIVVENDTNGVLCDMKELNHCDVRSTSCFYNSNGSLTCECKKGFTRKSETSCKDINECDRSDACINDINECDRSDACINGICENKNGTWDCFCHKGKKLKSINDTSKICYEEFHYVMSIQIASTSSVQGSKDDLMLYLEFQIKAAYEAAFRGHNVRIEIISITTQNEKRKRRDAAKNLKVKYIVHTDEETPSKNLTTAWHDYITDCGKTCIKKNGISSKLPFDIILSDDIVVENDTKGVLCDMKELNHCDVRSTSCFYNENGSLTCECKKGFTRTSETSCKVSEDACKVKPCDNGGECRIVNGKDESKRDFNCKCVNGWSGHNCQNRQEAINDSDTDTVFIATGTSIGVLVIILLIVVLVVCRWKRQREKETNNLSKMLRNTHGYQKSFNGSFRDDVASENSFDFRSFPRASKQDGKLAARNSMPNIAGDAHMYTGDNELNSSLEMGRPSSWDPRGNFGRSDRRRLSLPHESKRPPPSPRPDYFITDDRFHKPANSYQDYRQAGEFHAKYGDNIRF